MSPGDDFPVILTELFRRTKKKIPAPRPRPGGTGEKKYVGAVLYEQLKRSHKGWVEEYLEDGEKIRQEE